MARPDSTFDFKIPYLLNGEIFDIVSQSGDNVTVKCRHCPNNVYKGSVKSTGNFHMHIKRKHPHLISRVQALKLASMMHKKNSQKSMQDSSSRISRPRSTRSVATTTIPEHKNYTAAGRKLENLIQTKIRQNVLSSQSVNAMSNNFRVNRIDNTPAPVKSETVAAATRSKISAKTVFLPNGNVTPPAEDTVSVETHTSFEPFNNHDQINNFSISPAGLQCNGVNNRTNDNNYTSYGFYNPFSMRLDSQISQLHDCIKGIEKELHLRNQLEYHKMVFEFARFKHFHHLLNPNMI